MNGEVPAFIVYAKHNVSYPQETEVIGLYGVACPPIFNDDPSIHFYQREFVIDGMTTHSLLSEFTTNRSLSCFNLFTGILHIHGDDPNSLHVKFSMNGTTAPGHNVCIYFIKDLYKEPSSVDDPIKYSISVELLQLSNRNQTVSRWWHLMRDPHNNEIVVGHHRVLNELKDAKYNEISYEC